MTEHAAENALARTFTMNDSLPTLYIPWPRCGHCGKEVEIEDGAAHCEDCRVWWDRISEDMPAAPDRYREGTEVPCLIVSGEQGEPHDSNGFHYEPGSPKPCILPSGHEGSHLCPYDVTVAPISPGQVDPS